MEGSRLRIEAESEAIWVQNVGFLDLDLRFTVQAGEFTVQILVFGAH